jgi:hypothetical protein
MVALAAGIALVWTGPLTWGALSGMEVSLAAALVAGAMLAHARGHTTSRDARRRLPTLSRPKRSCWCPRSSSRSRSACAARGLIAIPLVALAPFVAFCVATVGNTVAATAAAKVEGGCSAGSPEFRSPRG